MERRRVRMWAIGLPICFAALFGVGLTRSGLRSALFSHGPSPETRGYSVAREQGCFHCHGAWGQGGAPNPGANTIPSFQDFTFMMSITDEYELREWILDGAPERLREHPDFESLKQQRALHMPAYRDRITDDQLELLLTCYNGISGTITPGVPAAKQGYTVALQSGCFACHGIGGRFDSPNPGSFVGRIPAWHGPDFADLAANDAEIREWILDGKSSRLERNPIARWFLQRQTIQMPAYRNQLTDGDVDAILAYIQWLRDTSAPGHKPKFGGGDSLLDDPLF
jgi:mono/diheme cytochrome c family protein